MIEIAIYVACALVVTFAFGVWYGCHRAHQRLVASLSLKPGTEDVRAELHAAGWSRFAIACCCEDDNVRDAVLERHGL